MPATEERQYTIKELRARKDVSQETAAKALGVSLQTYNAWEKNISNVKIGNVCKIADYYGVDLKDIFLPSNMK